jgi:ABC-2 type transport system permease protein
VIAANSLSRQVRASYALIERNINLSKRYWGWEIVFLVYTIAQSLAIVLIADGVPTVSKHSNVNTARVVLFLGIGALTWSYMASLFMAIAESVQWERWEGTIEYTLMAPISRFTYVLGSCVFAVIYGLARTAFVLGAILLMFHLHPNPAGIMPSLLIVLVGSLSFIGIGIMAATLPLLFTEKGAQMTYVIEACLLLVSGVYYPISVFQGKLAFLQVIAHASPATYILAGTRTMLLNDPSGSALLHNLVPLSIIGIITIPMGMWLFAQAEAFAKRTGRLKRTG